MGNYLISFPFLSTEIFIYLAYYLVQINCSKITEIQFPFPARFDIFLICHMVHVIRKKVNLIFIFQSLSIYHFKVLCKQACPFWKYPPDFVVPIDMTTDNNYLLISYCCLHIIYLFSRNLLIFFISKMINKFTECNKFCPLIFSLFCLFLIFFKMALCFTKFPVQLFRFLFLLSET